MKIFFVIGILILLRGVALASDVNSASVFNASSDFDGIHYQLDVTYKMIKACPKWMADQDPPLGIRKAKALALSAFQDNFKQYSHFRIMEVALEYLPNSGDWLYLVRFEEVENAKGQIEMSSGPLKVIKIVVLFDGNVVIPK